jgi:hypothetical protein
MLLFCTKGGCRKWGQRSTEHGTRNVPRTGQIQMKTGGNNEAMLETCYKTGRSHATNTSMLVDVKR